MRCTSFLFGHLEACLFGPFLNPITQIIQFPCCVALLASPPLPTGKLVATLLEGAGFGAKVCVPDGRAANQHMQLTPLPQIGNSIYFIVKSISLDLTYFQARVSHQVYQWTIDFVWSPSVTPSMHLFIPSTMKTSATPNTFSPLGHLMAFRPNNHPSVAHLFSWSLLTICSTTVLPRRSL